MTVVGSTKHIALSTAELREEIHNLDVVVDN
jgi:hypothetical protein